MEHEFEFVSTVCQDVGTAAGYMRHYIPLPADVSATLIERGVTHLHGRVELTEFRRALHKSQDGGLHLRFGKSWIRDAELDVGEDVVVAASVDPDPMRVEVPKELADLLAWEPEVADAWAAITPGRRKTLAYQITRAKRPETRERRAQALVEQLKQDLEEQTDGTSPNS